MSSSLPPLPEPLESPLMRRRRTSSSPAGRALGGGLALGLTTAVLVGLVGLMIQVSGFLGAFAVYYAGPAIALVVYALVLGRFGSPRPWIDAAAVIGGLAVVTLPLSRFLTTAAVLSWPLLAGAFATVVIALGSPDDVERRRLAARARRDELSR